MYSQALRQAYPESPLLPRNAAASASHVARRQRTHSTVTGKENIPPGIAPEISGKVGRSGGACGKYNYSLSANVVTAAGAEAATAASKATTGNEDVSAVDAGTAEKSAEAQAPSRVNYPALRPLVPPIQRTNGEQRADPSSAANCLPANLTRKFEGSEKSGKNSGVGVVLKIPAASGSGSASQDGSGTSLTEQQRQKMLENRAKALARLNQKKRVAGKTSSSRASPHSIAGGDVGSGGLGVAPGSQGPRVQRKGGLSFGLLSQHQTTQSSIQRERFRMAMDMDSGEEDSETESCATNAASASASASAAARVTIPHGVNVMGSKSKGGSGISFTQMSTTSKLAKSTTTSRPLYAVTSQSTSSAALLPPIPILSKLPAILSSPTPILLPLSAPRASALESLASELRSRPGVTVHASPLGGGLRDVDFVVGAQCAVCVRGRRQFLLQTHTISPSPSRTAGAGGGKVPGVGTDKAVSAPLVALLKACLPRYARIVILVELLEGNLAEGGNGIDVADGCSEQREAVEKVEALRGVSVVGSRGCQETADKVIALLRREANEGLGLPQEVRVCLIFRDPCSLSTANGKCSSVLKTIFFLFMKERHAILNVIVQC